MTDAGVRICQRVCAAIGAAVPPELGRWEKAWEITADAHDRFLEAVAKWEPDQRRETYAVVRGAFDNYVDAWKRALRLWREETA